MELISSWFPRRYDLLWWNGHFEMYQYKGLIRSFEYSGKRQTWMEWVGGKDLETRKRIEKRKVEGQHHISSVLLWNPWGQQAPHEPLKIIFWSQVGCLLSHFLCLMSAHSHQCSVCLSLTVWALLGTAQRTQFSISQAPYQGFVGNCSCLINGPEMTEHSLVCQGRNMKKYLPLIITTEWLQVRVEKLSCDTGSNSGPLYVLFPMPGIPSFLQHPFLPATPLPSYSFIHTCLLSTYYEAGPVWGARIENKTNKGLCSQGANMPPLWVKCHLF